MMLPTSVIVCTYNRAQFLRDTIRQLLEQDYRADLFEIIVVDNGSTDQTRQVVQSFFSPRGIPLRYIKETRRGVTFARNRGAKEAHYPYLAYLDDDCSVGSDWLSQLLSGFAIDERVSIVGGLVEPEYDGQQVPNWLGPKSERWLGRYSYPGSQPRLINEAAYVCEGNMAITRQAWETVGGFLGIDQFNSPHVAAQEIVYFLERTRRLGRQLAFVPNAVARHHTAVPTPHQLLFRAYWHGVSAGILEYILHSRTWTAIGYRTFRDTAAFMIFLLLSAISLAKFDKPAAVYHLLRATRRLGLVFSEMHWVGDWPRVKEWVSAHTLNLCR
jgi:glycosyltransferase involved in cell wall biosynthesis